MNHFMPADPSNFPQIQTTYPQSTANYTTPTTPFSAGPAPGEKRSYDESTSASPSNNLEDASRYVAEEDKRRRNTAASARFRVKKKQREQALEKNAKEASDRASALEARISQLEMENKWLRNLVTEKTGNDDVAELWSEFSKENVDARSPDSLKKGVGTRERVSKVEA